MLLLLAFEKETLCDIVVMGNTNSEEIKHELLDEKNERYFERVNARNKVKTQDMSIPSPSSSPFKSSRGKLRNSLRKLGSLKKKKGKQKTTASDFPQTRPPTDEPQNTPPSIQNVRSRAAMLERAEVQPNPGTISPIRNNRKSGRSKNKRMSSNSLSPLPLPRGSGSDPLLSTSNEGNVQSMNYGSYVPSSSKRAYKIKDENRAFTATLSNGMIWTEIVRGARITCISFSSTGYLAVGAENGVVAIVEIRNKKQKMKDGELLAQTTASSDTKYEVLRELPREGKIRSLDWSPSGDYLAIGGNDCTAVILEFETMRIVQEIEREDRVYAVRWSPDGNMLAVGGFDGMVAIISFPRNDTYGNGELVTEIPRLGLVLTLGWSSDGQFLAIGGSDKRAAIVSVESWEVVGEVQRPGSVQCVDWSPDGKFVCVGGHDGAVAVINIESKTILKDISRRRIDMSCRVTDVTWSPDGQFLAISGTDCYVAIYETRSFLLVQEVKRDQYVTCVDWRKSDGKYLAVGGNDNIAAILKTGGMVDVPERDASSISISQSPSSDWSVSEASETMSTKSNLPPGWEMMQEFDAEGQNDRRQTPTILFISFSCDDGFVALSCSDCRVMVLETQTWSVIHNISCKNPSKCLSFSQSNEYLAVASENSSTTIYSLPSFQVLTTIPYSGSINCLDFSSDSSCLALGDGYGMLNLISTSDWSILAENDSEDSPIFTLDWSTDGKFFATGRNNGVCTIHENDSILGNFWVANTEITRNSAICTVAFGAGHTFLAIGGQDWKVGIFLEKNNWSLYKELSMGGWVLSVAWSIDARYLALGGTDSKGGVVIDTSSWQCLNELGKTSSPESNGVCVGEEVQSVSWSRNDKYLAMGGTSGNTQIISTKTWEVLLSIDNQGVITNVTTVSSSDEDIYEDDTEEEDGFSTYYSEESKSSDTDHLTQHLLSNNDMKDTRLKQSEDSLEDQGSVDGYFTRTEPQKFLDICEAFLSEFQFDPPHPCINLFISCIMNLKSHVLWLNSLPPLAMEEISIENDSQHLGALCRILDRGTFIMDEIIENEEQIIEWWRTKETFQLDEEEVKRLENWNLCWSKLDPDVVEIDIALLRRVDEPEVYSNLDLNSYQSIESPHESMSTPIDAKKLMEEYGNQTDDSSSSWSSDVDI